MAYLVTKYLQGIRGYRLLFCKTKHNATKEPEYNHLDVCPGCYSGVMSRMWVQHVTRCVQCLLLCCLQVQSLKAGKREERGTLCLVLTFKSPRFLSAVKSLCSVFDGTGLETSYLTRRHTTQTAGSTSGLC